MVKFAVFRSNTHYAGHPPSLMVNSSRLPKRYLLTSKKPSPKFSDGWAWTWKDGHHAVLNLLSSCVCYPTDDLVYLFKWVLVNCIIPRIFG